MATPEELVRETFDRYSIRGDAVILTRAQALTLAREAAKRALLDAADSFTMPATGAKIRPWLRARAEQIGKDT